MNRVEVLKGAYNRFPVRPSSPEGLTGELDLAHVEFSPIDSLASLRDLAQSLDGISGIMHVASLALDGAPIGLRAVDSVILRALAHGALGGSFEFVSFDDDAVKRLSHMTKKDVMKSLEDALHGIEDSLRAALLPETLKHGEKGWAVSRDAHIYVEDPMRHVTTELGALKDQLLLAHQHGHLFELLRETLS
jgi:hypothetical protein